MPDSDGKFRGISIPSDAWTRIFGPALADDPDPDGDELFDIGPTVGHCSKCGEVREEFYTCRDGGSTVPSETADEVQPDRDCPAGHGRCCCLPGSTSEAWCHAEMDLTSRNLGPEAGSWSHDSASSDPFGALRLP